MTPVCFGSERRVAQPIVSFLTTSSDFPASFGFLHTASFLRRLPGASLGVVQRPVSTSFLWCPVLIL